MIASLVHAPYYRPYCQLMQPDANNTRRRPDYITLAVIITQVAVEALLLGAFVLTSPLLPLEIVLTGVAIGLLESTTYLYSKKIKEIVVRTRRIEAWEQRRELPTQITKPIVLILISEDMPDLFINKRSLLRQLEMQHTVVWKRIGSQIEAQQAIEAVAERGPIAHLIWNGHGNNRHILLSETGNETHRILHLLNANNLQLIETIKRSLQPDATIVFWACKTAKTINHRNQQAHLARAFAQATARRVIGATTKLRYPLCISVKQRDQLEFKLYTYAKLPHMLRRIKSIWFFCWCRYLPRWLRTPLSRDVTYDSHRDPLVNPL